MSNSGAQFPVQVPVFTVLGTMKVEKILQHLGGTYQFGVEFLGKYMAMRLPVGNIDTTLQIIGREDSDLFGKRNIAIIFIHSVLRSSGAKIVSLSDDTKRYVFPNTVPGTMKK